MGKGTSCAGRVRCRKNEEPPARDRRTYWSLTKSRDRGTLRGQRSVHEVVVDGMDQGGAVVGGEGLRRVANLFEVASSEAARESTNQQRYKKIPFRNRPAPKPPS